MTDHGPPSADELLRQAAFVRAVARDALRSTDLVDDVVQDTWVSVLTRPARLRGTLRGWLGRVARSRAIDALRRESAQRRRAKRVAQVSEAHWSEGTDEIAARVETGRYLAKAVLELEDPYRTTVLLRYYDGLSRRDVAERMGVSVETVHTRLRRGLARLRARLAAEYGVGTDGWIAVVAPLATAPAGVSITPGVPLGAATIMMKKMLVGSLALAVLVAGGAMVSAIWSPNTPSRPASSGKDVVVAAAPPAKPESEMGSPRDPSPEPTQADAVPIAPEIPGPVLTNEQTSPEDGPTLEGKGDAMAAEGSSADPKVAVVDEWEVDRERDLHGVVVRTDGAPVVGAELRTARRPWDVPKFASREGWTQEEVPGPSTRTDGAGRFVLRLDAGAVVDLHVAAAGLPAFYVHGVQAGERFRLVMPDPVSLIVLVLDPRGRPAPGVEVGLRTSISGTVQLERESSTNEQGQVTFAGLPPSLEVSVSVREMREGWGRVHERVTLPGRGEDALVLRAPLARTLRGRVVDASTRQAIPNATVADSWFGGDYSVRTDDDGRYIFPSWSGTGAHRLHAFADGYALLLKPVGRSQVVDFALVPGATLAGRVVDSQGEPIVNARLKAAAHDEESKSMRWLLSLGSSCTDLDGRFEIPGLLPRREHELRVLAPGYALMCRPVPAIGPSATLDLGDLVLARSSTIAVKVLNLDGTPLARQTVRVCPIGTRGPALSLGALVDCRTDDLGRARLAGIGPGRYVVRLVPPWSNCWKVVDVPEEGSVVSVDLCPGTRLIVVHVVDDLGTPVPRVQIHAKDFEWTSGPPPQRFGIGGWTDGSGRAEIHVEAGVPVQLTLSRSVRKAFEGAEERTLRPDEDETTFVLTRKDVLTGTLLGPEGNPIVRGALEVEGPRGLRQPITTGDDGCFQAQLKTRELVTLRFQGLVGLEPIEKPVRRPWIAVLENVDPTAHDVTLRAQPVATLQRLDVRVLDPTGQPAPGVEVRLDVHEDGRPSDASGQVTYEGLPELPIGIHLVFEPTSERPWIAPAPQRVVPDGQSIEIRLLRGSVFRGRALMPDGTACAGGTVTARWVSPPPARMLSHRVTIEPDGRFLVVLDPSVKGRVNFEGQSVNLAGVVCKGWSDWLPAGTEEIVLTLSEAED